MSRAHSEDDCSTLPYIGRVCLDSEDWWWILAMCVVPPVSVWLVLQAVLTWETAAILSATALVTGVFTLWHGRRQARLKRVHDRQLTALAHLAERRHDGSDDDL